MSDLISRQAAIDALEEQLDYLQMLNKNENPTAESEWYGVNWARNTIADLPPAQQWIPFSERLPKDHQDILVCGKYGGMWVDTFDCNDYKNLMMMLIDYGSVDDNVLAWMPLPEPYEGS